MKIAAVTFTGLKGACRTTHSSSEYEDSTFIRLNYYPFKDESKNEVDQFVKEHSCFENYSGSAYRDDCGVIHGLEDHYSLTRKVNVLDNLPFTKDEYRMYNSHPDVLPMTKRLEIKAILEEIEREKEIIK